MKMSLEERFNQYVHPEPNSGCWLWSGAQNSGYGQFSVGGRSGRRFRASHIALILSGKPKPFVGAVARHRCDCPPCVNPDHLEWGTAKQNSADAMSRGRLKLRGLNIGNPGKRSLSAFCRKGHPWAEFGRTRPNGSRECKECHRIAEAQRRFVA